MWSKWWGTTLLAHRVVHGVVVRAFHAEATVSVSWVPNINDEPATLAWDQAAPHHTLPTRHVVYLRVTTVWVLEDDFAHIAQVWQHDVPSMVGEPAFGLAWLGLVWLGSAWLDPVWHGLQLRLVLEFLAFFLLIAWLGSAWLDPVQPCLPLLPALKFHAFLLFVL